MTAETGTVMNGKLPHIGQYQGSKRILAPQILSFMPKKFHRLIEPFAGTAAVSVAAAAENRADVFYLNDLNAPLTNLLRKAIEEPSELAREYAALWNEQFSFGERHTQHFFIIRDRFNQGEKFPANLLYLMSRCVKGAVRYGKNGNFNQSPDKRRHGAKPETLSANLRAVSRLLKGRTVFSSLDYRETLALAKPGDLVYMDPPYQGVTNVRDSRYVSGVPFREFVEAVGDLRRRGIDYLISYDGRRGETTYGEEIPAYFHCKKTLLNAGTSAQSTLLGRKDTTFEALYVSPTLCAMETTL